MKVTRRYFLGVLAAAIIAPVAFTRETLSVVPGIAVVWMVVRGFTSVRIPLDRDVIALPIGRPQGGTFYDIQAHIGSGIADLIERNASPAEIEVRIEELRPRHLPMSLEIESIEVEYHET